MNDKIKTMMLHISLAAFETVRNEEVPKSRRYLRMNKAIDRILELIDDYRIEAWPVDDIIKASELVDEFNLRIAEVFSDTIPPDKFVFNFPRIKFVDENGIIKQLSHIRSEVDEIEASAYTPDIQHTALEAMDCLHSAESLLRILAEKHGIDLAAIRAAVEEKNRVRGYYRDDKKSQK